MVSPEELNEIAGVEHRVLPTQKKHLINDTIKTVDLILTWEKVTGQKGKTSWSQQWFHWWDWWKEGEMTTGRGLQASPESCDLGSGEKDCILHPPEQLLKATTIPRDFLGPEQVLSTSGRLRQGDRERNPDLIPDIHPPHLGRGCCWRIEGMKSTYWTETVS